MPPRDPRIREEGPASDSPGAQSASPARIPDAEAVARARKGDHEGFRILVERYQARAYRLALRVLRDEETARDAVQEALLKAYASLSRFEGRSSFYTWLYRLVMNQCLDLKRRDKSARHVDWDDGDPLEEAASSLPPPEVAGVPFAPAAEVMRKELREHVSAAIEQLPDDARRTLLLREVDGLSYAEIAKAQGIPKGTVMSRLHYARRRVRELLLEAGVRPTHDADGSREVVGRGEEQ